MTVYTERIEYKQSNNTNDASAKFNVLARCSYIFNIVSYETKNSYAFL